MALQLFCLPHSGASAMVYARWRRLLPAWIEVRPVELPGRGRRFDEPFATDLRLLARQLAAEIAPATARPYALFGHSLGALLALEMAHALSEQGAPAPRALLASGTEAPTRRDDAELRGALSDESLIARLRSLGGTASAVLEDAELMALTLPVLRADFHLCGHYQPLARPPLSCSLHVFAGREDDASEVVMQAWQQETRGAFSLDWFQGDHFFINSQESEVLGVLVAHLQAAVATAGEAKPA
ncbi:thioesterase II family protein [Pseudomonas rhizoryzae]|uniref:thioesterase II family protein n=1 Tax=Pseudomonas rhizoryzae TaxID=2571129 RepID=UPI000737AC33|nr:alpha/beta fold hydrolase [Pseudomonas rhizoryzae]KTT28369.1 thioesterase [Pseudomonas psychrotolerans]KTT34512.1 thioesterase [Pseudomonas psychrotolerans]KTT78192.1 thioesterase [Pseudomonas psychrotolerans]